MKFEMYDEIKVVDKESEYFGLCGHVAEYDDTDEVYVVFLDIGYGVEIDREIRESQLEALEW